MASVKQSDDWQISKSVTECNVEMFEQQICTDVTFNLATPSTPVKIPSKKRKLEQNTSVGTANTGARIEAHTYVLVSRSPVFMAMFHGLLAERSGTVNIEDCDNEAAFRQFLRFLYSDDTELSVDTVMDVLYLARKYMVPALEVQCNRFIQQHLHVGSVCSIASHAMKISDDEILQMCLGFIRTNQSEVFCFQKFVEIPKLLLECILDEQYMSAPAGTILDSCIKWAEWQHKASHKSAPSGTELRDILGSCLYKIPFIGLDAKTFTVKVVDSGLLTPDVAFHFYRCFSIDATKDAPAIPKEFTEIKRTTMERLGFDSTLEYTNPIIITNNDFDSGIIDVNFINNRKRVINRLCMCFRTGVDECADSFRLDFDPNCVSVNGVPCLERIGYRDFKTNSDNYVLVVLYLSAVEITNQCQMILKLISEDTFREIVPASAHFKGENTLKLIWSKFPNRVPFYRMSCMTQSA